MTGYSKNNIQERLDKLENLEYISEKNFEHLKNFIRNLQLDGNLGESRVYWYISKFKMLHKKFIDDDTVLKECSVDEIRNIVGRIEQTDYADWSKWGFKTALKRFFNTQYEHKFDRPKRVKKILDSDALKKRRNIENKRDTEAIEPSEIMDMVEEAENERDKLMPLFMFETGARIGEALGLRGAEGIKLKDIELKQKYAKVEVETLKNKNKGSKEQQLVRSVGLLQDWLEKHPRSDDPEAHLFVNIGSKYKGKCMSEKNFADVLRKLAEKAGVDKPIRNHIFRHSSATYKGTELGWNLNRMMYWHGWTDPKMAKKYCKENEKRMRAQRLREEGIEPDEEEDGDALEMKVCSRCGEKCAPTSKYCGNCSLSLDKEVAIQEEELKEAGDVVTTERLEENLSEEEIKERKKEILGKMENLQTQFEKL